MGNTVKGLPNNGATTHYQIEYDDALPSALSLAQGLQASCEADFALMQSWFGGFDLIAGYPIRVHIANASGGAEWPNPVLGLGSDVTLKPKPAPTVALLRSLLVMEVAPAVLTLGKPSGAILLRRDSCRGWTPFTYA